MENPTKMFHVKHGKRLLCFSLAMLIFFGSFTGAYIKSRAIAVTLGAVATYEVISTILLSVGVTALGAGVYQELKNNDAFQQQIDSIISTLNEKANMVGDEILNAIHSMAVTSKGMILKLGQSTWNKLKSFSQSIAQGVKTNFNFGLPISGNLDKLLSSAHSVVPSNVLPLDSEGNRYTGTNVTDTVSEHFGNFIARAKALTGVENPKLSIYYTYQGIDTTKGKYGFIFLANSSNSAVGITSITGADATGYYGNYILNLDSSKCTAFGLYYKDHAWTTSSLQYGDMVSSALSKVNLATFGLAQAYGIGDVSTIPTVIGNVLTLDVPAVTVPGVGDIVGTGGYDVVTTGRVLNPDGTLTGDVVITFPTDLAGEDVIGGVLDGTESIPEALDRVGVIPVDTINDVVIDTDVPIVDVIDPSVPVDPPTGNPNVNDYNLGLQYFFPFCLPFDVMNFLNCFKASPVAPSIKFTLPTGYKNGKVLYSEFEIDMAQFNQVASVLRKFELLAFCVGLAYVTRSMFIRS